jgi:hypothetical protein
MNFLHENILIFLIFNISILKILKKINLIATVFLNIHYNPNPFHFNISQLSHLTFLHAR